MGRTIGSPVQPVNVLITLRVMLSITAERDEYV